MLNARHASFLRDYANRDDHYSLEEAPQAYFDRFKSIPPEKISKALNDSDEYIRSLAIEHPDVTAEHIDKALMDSAYRVRAKAAKNKNTTSEQLEQVINDPESYVRYQVATHDNATNLQLHRLVNDKDEEISRRARMEVAHRYSK